MSEEKLFLTTFETIVKGGIQQHINLYYTTLYKPFLQDPEVSFECKVCYGEYLAGVIEFQDIPQDLKKEILNCFEKNVEVVCE